MKRVGLTATVLVGAVLLSSCSGIPAWRPETATTQSLSTWDAVGKVLGRKGAVQGGVFRVTFPRQDLNVHIGPVRLETALALTSWVAFHGTGPHSIMMGDLVLLDTEIDGVIAKLVEGGLQVTTLHNHLQHESPRVMFLHIAGEGDPLDLAERVKRALALTGTQWTEQPPGESPRDARLDVVEKTFGRRGSRTGDVLQFSIPRPEAITMHGTEIPPAMGVAHAINFQVAGNDVATAGDLVVLANEVNPVVHALTGNGITVTAIHNHMLEEWPRVFFLHFWGMGRPKLVRQSTSRGNLLEVLFFAGVLRLLDLLVEQGVRQPIVLEVQGCFSF